MLAEPFCAGVDVALEHIDKPWLAAAVRGPRIDRAEGDQSIAKRLRLGQHEIGAQRIAG
jgi:hypothetical protein